MRNWTYLFIILALAATVAAAPTFSTTLVTEKSIIFTDEVALFSVAIVNNENSSDLFTVSTPEFDWMLNVDEQIGEIAPGETKTAIIELTPKSSIQPGTHVVRVKVRSANTNNFDILNAFISVRNTNESNRTYAPSIFMSAQVPATVDPRQDLTVSVYLRNRNARNYDKLSITLQSDIFTKTYTTSLGAIGDEGEKTNQVTVLLDPTTQPGTHPLTVSINADNIIVNEYKTQFAVQSYQDTNAKTTAATSFFKTITTYVVVNNGNTEQIEHILHPTNIMKRLFTTATAQYTVKQTAVGSELDFAVTLGQQQQSEVSVTENYRLLVILIMLVIISVISYFLFRSPVILSKEAAIIGSSTDGVSEMKIRVFIKNRSAKAITSIHIIDKVTSMAEVVKESALGTLQPSKVIKKKGHGTLVRWDIETLEAFEERIITYRVKTELKLIGDVYLPAAKAKFDQHGRERNAYSNEVNIPREA